MRFGRILFLLGVSLLLSGCRGMEERPVTPKIVTHAFTDIEGRPARLQDVKARALLVDFWATWCPQCVRTLPTLNRLYAKYRGKGLAVVGVSVDEKGAAAVKPFLAKHPARYPIWFDLDKKNPRWKALGIRELPTLLLLDGSGQRRPGHPRANASWNSIFPEKKCRIRTAHRLPNPLCI